MENILLYKNRISFFLSVLTIVYFRLYIRPQLSQVTLSMQGQIPEFF